MKRYRRWMRRWWGSRLDVLAAGWHRRAVAAVATAGLLAAGGLTGCGGDVEQTTFTELNREAFLAACTETSTDDRLVRDVCECTYDEIEANLALEDLVALEESLKLDSLSPLPDTIAEILADCFVAEADL